MNLTYSSLALVGLRALVDNADVTVQRAAGARLVGALIAFVRLLLHVHRDDVLLHVNLEIVIIISCLMLSGLCSYTDNKSCNEDP